MLELLYQRSAGNDASIFDEASFSLFFSLSGAPLQRLNVEAGHTSITHWQKVTPPPGFLSDSLLERYNDRSHLLRADQSA